MFCTIISGAVYGISGYFVQVEVNVSPGLPCFAMVGYLSSEVKEAAERVRVALKNTGISIPPMHITVNLSPANIRKEGAAFDLPIAAGILVCLGIIKPQEAEDMLVIGELGLDGSVKGVKGILPIVTKAAAEGIKTCLVPADNLLEAAVVPRMQVYGIQSLQEILDYFNSSKEIRQEKQRVADAITNNKNSPEERNLFPSSEVCLDFKDIAGQEAVKRAVTISAAGFHHLLLIGPPGSGKTMVAKRISTILPPLSTEESLEVSSIYSIAGLLQGKNPITTIRPFYSPHHTITEQALIGGGRHPKPGVISLAHRGVLFMDELPECKHSVLEVLRQPLEDKKISIARSSGSFTYPADCVFVGAMNPCPCGYFPDYDKCHCTPFEVHRYLNKLSGPILDRIDICIEVPKVSVEQLQTKATGESSAQMRTKVAKARDMQKDRYAGTAYSFNSDLPSGEVSKYCYLNKKEQQFIESIFTKMGLSARAYHRVLKVARTIADLAQEERIRQQHLMEAVCYRMSDEQYWRK